MSLITTGVIALFTFCIGAACLTLVVPTIMETCMDDEIKPFETQPIALHVLLVLHGFMTFALVIFELFVVQLRKNINLLSGICGSLMVIIPFIPVCVSLVMGVLGLNQDMHGPIENGPIQNQDGCDPCECWVGSDHEQCNISAIEGRIEYKYKFGISIGTIFAFVLLSCLSSTGNILRIFNALKFFLPLPKRFFNKLLAEWEEKIGTFGVSIRRAKFCLRREKFLVFPLPNNYQVPFGCFIFTTGIVFALFAEIFDLVLDGVYYYKLGSGELLDRRINVSVPAQMSMFLFTVFGAVKSPLNVVLLLRQLQETNGKIKSWQIGNMEVTLGANALFGFSFINILYLILSKFEAILFTIIS